MPHLKATEAKKDPIKALILERKLALKLDDEEISRIIGVSRQTYSKMLNHSHTDEWSMGRIKRLCRAMNITVDELRCAVRYQ